MNVEKLDLEIKAHNEIISAERLKVREKELAIAVHLCPFAVGETVLNGRGEKEIISAIRHTSWREVYGFSTYKIKTDGKPYKNDARVYDTDKYTKVGGES